MEAKEALKIYKSVSQPPASALRQITAGDLKGKTDINPQWRYEAMTQTFGLVGIGWKYEVQKLWTEPGAKGEMLAFAQVAVFVRDPDTKEWSDPIVGIGGSKLINMFSTGAKSNDEGYKMAVTDAFSTSLKMLGIAADVYAGRWDGTKYNEQQQNGEGSSKNKTTAPNKKNTNQPKGGADTPEQRNRINSLLSSTKTDGSKVFTKEECSQIGGMRQKNTADEVIQFLELELKKRTAANFPEDIPYEVAPGQEVTPEEEAGADAAFDVF